MDAHLVQHVGNGREHIRNSTHRYDVGVEAICITSFGQQFFCTVGIELVVVDIIIVGNCTGNCPLISHLCRTHQESSIQCIHINGVAHCTTDASIGPGAVNGTVGDQTQCTNAHTVFITFSHIDAIIVQILFDQRRHIKYLNHIVLIGTECGLSSAGLGDHGDLDGIQIGQAFLPVILVLGIDSVGVVLELAQLEGAGAAGSGIQAAGVLKCLGAHVVNEEANGFQRRGVGLCHHHLDVGVVNDLALGNVCGLGTVIGLILFNIALDCLGIERLTVGKFDVLPQGPGDAVFIIVHVPLGSQLGNHIAVIVIGQQVLISQIQIEQQCITGCTGGIARSCNGVAVAQAKGSACLGFPGCCCAGSGRTGGAGCGGAGRSAARGQCQGRCGNAHSLEEVPTRDAFHSGFSFLSFLFLRSSARFCVCRAFVVFSLTHRELFQLPKNRN